MKKAVSHAQLFCAIAKQPRREAANLKVVFGKMKLIGKSGSFCDGIDRNGFVLWQDSGPPDTPKHLIPSRKRSAGCLVGG